MMNEPTKPLEYMDQDGEINGKRIMRIWYCCPNCNKQIHIGCDCECGQIIDWR